MTIRDRFRDKLATGFAPSRVQAGCPRSGEGMTHSFAFLEREWSAVFDAVSRAEAWVHRESTLSRVPLASRRAARADLRSLAHSLLTRIRCSAECLTGGH